MASFEFHCERCGSRHSISATQAGSSLVCRCGYRNTVPALGELRQRAGLATYEKSIAETIREMVGNQQLPAGSECLECGGPHAEDRRLVATCERARMNTRTSGGGMQGPFLVGLIAGLPFVLPLGGHARSDVAEEQFGRDVIVPVPARLCPHCWSQLSGSQLVRLFRLVLWLFVASTLGATSLWFLAPFTGWPLPFRWPLYGLAATLVWAWGKHWYASRRLAALRTTLRKVPVYRDLLAEYPDAEIALRNPDEQANSPRSGPSRDGG